VRVRCLRHTCHMLRRSVESHATALVLLVVMLSAVAALAVIYTKGYGGVEGEGPIRGDVMGYYIYLPAAFLDRDVSLVRTVDRSFDGNAENTYSDLQRVDGGYLGPHQIGVAIMLVPFFAVGHVIAVARGEPRDGFSWPYQTSVAAGGLLYGVLGLALLGSFLGRWFDRAIVAATLLALTFGTNLFHYLTYDAGYSHAFSFAAVAFVLWSTMRLADGRTAGNTSRGMRRWPVSSASQSSRRMSKQRVREAFEGSVAWTRPPVSCQRSQLSTVPNASSPRAARSRRSGRASRSHAIFVPEK